MQLAFVSSDKSLFNAYADDGLRFAISISRFATQRALIK